MWVSNIQCIKYHDYDHHQSNSGATHLFYCTLSSFITWADRHHHHNHTIQLVDILVSKGTNFIYIAYVVKKFKILLLYDILCKCNYDNNTLLEQEQITWWRRLSTLIHFMDEKIFLFKMEIVCFKMWGWNNLKKSKISNILPQYIYVRINVYVASNRSL